MTSKQTKTPFWWPSDARTHGDRTRCTTCGHSVAYHAHETGKGNHGGRCSVVAATGEQCSCRTCTRPATRKEVV